MSTNFWDEKLNEADQSKSVEDKKKSPQELTKPVTKSGRGKINVTLADFPVGEWDSDNDAGEIVNWYNFNTKEGNEKTVAQFKSISGVKNINSNADAQKLLDTVIATLEEEDCTEWDMPHNHIGLHPHPFAGLVGGWFFTAIWCLASVLATILIGSPVIADLGTSDWDPVDGIITDSGVDESTDGEGGTTYCLWVEYQYVVDNVTYDGDIISYSKDNSCNSWTDLDTADEKYPVGKNITVYVNPNVPSEAVLQTGLSGVSFFLCCFFIFPLIGLLLLFNMSKKTIGFVRNLW